MKVTTVRFGKDLWALLQHEARLAGVSVSQYIREAALARASAAAAGRGDPPFELLAGAIHESTSSDLQEAEQRHAAGFALAALARVAAAEARANAQAVRGESEQARRKAKSSRALR